MSEIGALYESEIKCPVCAKKIKVTKLRSRFLKLQKNDTDFCPHYELDNPILYEAWICKNCGYAAHSSVFQEIIDRDAKKVLEKITPRWTSRDFNGRRTYEKAIQAYKIVLYNLQIREANYSEYAKVCLRIAWIYRYMEKEKEEKEFLKYSLDFYEKTYMQERLPIKGLDEHTCCFIIGELSRRIGDNKNAMTWFSRLITASTNPKEKLKINPHMLETCRDMIHEVKKCI